MFSSATKVAKTALSWAPALGRRALFSAAVGAAIGFLPRMVEAMVKLGRKPDEIPATSYQIEDLRLTVEALRYDLAQTQRSNK